MATDKELTKEQSVKALGIIRDKQRHWIPTGNRFAEYLGIVICGGRNNFRPYIQVMGRSLIIPEQDIIDIYEEIEGRIELRDDDAFDKSLTELAALREQL